MTNNDYALVVYINHHHDNKEIVAIHICKRVKYSYIRESEVNSGEQLLKVVDTKNNIYELRNEIVDKLNEKIPTRKFLKNTQDSHVHIPILSLEIFKDLLHLNEQNIEFNYIGRRKTISITIYNSKIHETTPKIAILL